MKDDSLTDAGASPLRMVFLTGRPGVGKSRVVKETVRILEKRGYVPGGVSTPELRREGVRVGFQIVDVMTGNTGTLALTTGMGGVPFGKYRVNTAEIERVGVEALRRGVQSADYIVIDEVGPMELLSKEFQIEVERVINSVKPVLGVVHRRMRHPIIGSIKSRGDSLVKEVRVDNRDTLPRLIAEIVAKAIKVAD